MGLILRKGHYKKEAPKKPGQLPKRTWVKQHVVKIKSK
jgi:hypothetical protein